MFCQSLAVMSTEVFPVSAKCTEGQNEYNWANASGWRTRRRRRRRKGGVEFGGEDRIGQDKGQFNRLNWIQE